jgi:hypothetical protein
MKARHFVQVAFAILILVLQISSNSSAEVDVRLYEYENYISQGCFSSTHKEIESVGSVREIYKTINSSTKDFNLKKV